MKKRKIKWNIIIAFLLLSCFIIFFIFSILHNIEWKNDQKKIYKQLSDINNQIEITEKEDSETVEIIEQESELAKENLYWDYIKMPLIDVDFSELEKKNPSTLGWIQVKGTNINYPFVKTTNNNYYLTHSFDNSPNNAGWIFMDYRNNIENKDKNYIIYAHGRLDNTMFGSLKNIFTNGWIENKNNHIIKLSTKTENSLWQVFSIYKIKTTNDYLKIQFANDNEFLEFANMLKIRSEYDFNTDINKNDQILTLSTCYNNSMKVVLHAKLIKRKKKANL